MKGSQKRYQISTLRANSLSIRTGNFLSPYRELNRAIRVIFAPIRESRCRPLFRQQPWRQIVIVPTDLERCREGGTGTPPDARGRRSRSPARGRLCPSERRARHAQNRSPSLSTRTIGVPGLHDGAWSRRARPGCTELTADGGPMVRIHLPPAASRRRTRPILPRHRSRLGEGA